MGVVVLAASVSAAGEGEEVRCCAAVTAVAVFDREEAVGCGPTAEGDG